jgi:hypothetical protein
MLIVLSFQVPSTAWLFSEAEYSQRGYGLWISVFDSCLMISTQSSVYVDTANFLQCFNRLRILQAFHERYQA